MKKSFLVLLTLGCAWAQADLVVEQKMESSVMNGKIVAKYKGDQVRMDMNGPVGEMTTIMDLKAGETTSLIHAQKMVMKQKIPTAGAGTANAGDGPKVEPPKSTGKKEKVGDWDAEIFETTTKSQGQEIVTKMWVAKDFPNYKAIAEQMKKASAGAAAGAGVDPNKFDLGGMVVKTETTAPVVGKMTTTLVKVTETPVDASEFKVPDGYTEFKVPGK